MSSLALSGSQSEKTMRNHSALFPNNLYILKKAVVNHNRLLPEETRQKYKMHQNSSNLIETFSGRRNLKSTTVSKTIKTKDSQIIR